MPVPGVRFAKKENRVWLIQWVRVENTAIEIFKKIYPNFGLFEKGPSMFTVILVLFMIIAIVGILLFRKKEENPIMENETKIEKNFTNENGEESRNNSEDVKESRENKAGSLHCGENAGFVSERSGRITGPLEAAILTTLEKQGYRFLKAAVPPLSF